MILQTTLRKLSHIFHNCRFVSTRLEMYDKNERVIIIHCLHCDLCVFKRDQQLNHSKKENLIKMMVFKLAMAQGL